MSLHILEHWKFSPHFLWKSEDSDTFSSIFPASEISENLTHGWHGQCHPQTFLKEFKYQWTVNNVKLTTNKEHTKFDTCMIWELIANSQQIRENSNKISWEKLEIFLVTTVKKTFQENIVPMKLLARFKYINFQPLKQPVWRLDAKLPSSWWCLRVPAPVTEWRKKIKTWKTHKKLPMNSISKQPPPQSNVGTVVTKHLKYISEECIVSTDMPSFRRKGLSRWAKHNWPTYFPSFYWNSSWPWVAEYSHHKSHVPFPRDSHFSVWGLDKSLRHNDHPLHNSPTSTRPHNYYFSVFDLPKPTQTTAIFPPKHVYQTTGAVLIGWAIAHTACDSPVTSLWHKDH